MSDPASKTTQMHPLVESLRAEWKGMQPEIVDLSCRIKFMQWRLRQGLKKADLLRDVIAIYEGEKSENAQ